ncbi:MAG: ABC transporter ATP-binding protein, partial [Clostridia bacterium]|nr:ABC transporter ATP-binding protein [Clostridia bacterium]
LSPMRLMTLLCQMHLLVEEDSQLIIATHSPILMAYPGAEVLELGPEGITPTDWRQTEHYQVTKAFLDAPERMLSHLLEEG